MAVMFFTARIDPQRVVGKPPERLDLDELAALEGRVVALEIYTPEGLPERRIEAIGETAEECAAALSASGRDPRRYEFTVLKMPR